MPTAVMNQEAQEANLLLGGDESCLLLDESGFEKKGDTLDWRCAPVEWPTG